MLLRSGTIVDTTIIAAPGSTENATATRDLDMKQTGQCANRHIGIRLYIGVDSRGFVHTLTAANAAMADISQFLELLGGTKWEVFGDQTY